MGRLYKILAIVFAIFTIHINIKNARTATDFLIDAFLEYEEDDE